MTDLRDLTGKAEEKDFTPTIIVLALVVLVGAFLLSNPAHPPAPQAPAPQPAPSEQPVAPAPVEQPRPPVEQPRPQPQPQPQPQPTAPTEVVPSGADLTIDSIEAMPYPVTLRKFPLTVSFANKGADNAGPFKLLVEIRNSADTVYSKEFPFDGLGAGASNSLKFDFLEQYDGNYVVLATINSTHSAKESNEHNNVAVKTIHLYSKPDLVISYLDLRPNPPVALQDAFITLRVKNISPIPAPKGGYVRLDLPNADTPYIVLRIPEVLQQNQEYEFKDVKVMFSGDYARVNAMVDSSGVIAEDDEANNTAIVDVEPSIPDVEIDSMKVTGPAEITVGIANNSNARLNTDFRVFLKADGLLFGGVDNTSFLVGDAFEAGQVIEYKVRNVTPYKLLFNVQVVADPDGFVAEANKKNNELQAQLKFGG